MENNAIRRIKYAAYATRNCAISVMTSGMRNKVRSYTIPQLRCGADILGPMSLGKIYEVTQNWQSYYKLPKVMQSVHKVCTKLLKVAQSCAKLRKVTQSCAKLRKVV